VLTEVVHCKSRNNVGVHAAKETCTSRWLRQVLNASGAAVVVGLGLAAASGVRNVLGIHGEPVHIETGDRHFLFVGAPGSSSARRLDRVITSQEARESIRDAARRARNGEGGDE